MDISFLLPFLGLAFMHFVLRFIREDACADHREDLEEMEKWEEEAKADHRDQQPPV